MAKIKKISELEQLSSLSSSANVIIEENGKAKRIAASKLVVSGGGEGGTSVQPDWDQTDETKLDFIKNKPDEMDALLLVSEMGFTEPAMVDANNNVYLDESDNILIL